jgi:Virulence factor
MTRPTRRRARGGPRLLVIYWRDIPSQVSGTTADGHTEKVLLEPRFQHAIDRAAHVAGLTDTDDYVAEWRRVDRSGDPTIDAAATAALINRDYPRDRLEALVASGGLAPTGQTVNDQTVNDQQ